MEFIVGDTEIAFTVGHSTHTLDALVAILRRNGVACVADVRRYPRSRRLPHFNAEALGVSLSEADIGYVHMPELGGFRRSPPGPLNAGWENASFRAYADYMQTDEFEAALTRLRELRKPALMCAEAQWWRCHRRLIADALTARGVQVVHIRFDGRTEPHALTPFAVVAGGRVSYPPQQAPLDV